MEQADQAADIGEPLVDAKQRRDQQRDADPAAEDPPFDLESFSSIVQSELVTYSLSWEPLMNALRLLAASLARQQRAQQNNNSSVEEVSDDVRTLRDQLARADEDKQSMATALDKLQTDMAGMQSQLEQLASKQDEQQAKQDELAQLGQQAQQAPSPIDTPVKEKTPRLTESPRLNASGPFVTTKDLADAQKALARELKRSLSQSFGHDVVDAEGGEDGGPIGSFRVPGGPFATIAEMNEAFDKMRELQQQHETRLATHDQRLDALQSSVGNLDDQMLQLSAQVNDTAEQLSSRLSTPPVAHTPILPPITRKEPDGDDAANAILLQSLKDLKAAQEAHDKQLQQHAALAGQHAAELKSLTGQLEDLALQQSLSMASGGMGGNWSNNSNGNDNGNDMSSGEGVTSAADNKGDSSQGDKDVGKREVSAPQPGLDLSLVFAKIADMRRSTDASLNSLQHNLQSMSGVTHNQQAQLDALRNSAVFGEHLQVHMIEAQLAMQKELLARNQAYQDRTKPQIAEWRKALAAIEDKLNRGLADDEILEELRQLQRYYSRTMLSITPLVNSPLAIAESMQTLADQVRQLDNGVKVGVLPVRVGDGDGNDPEAARHARDREEEYARKLRFLDEEIAATLQVNVVTEKKNDPLIKSLDAMREKLESLSTMWHKNYNHKLRDGSGSVGGSSSVEGAGGGHSTQTSAPGQSGGEQVGSEALRDVEMRLLSAVRRLGALEEDVERLNAATELNTAELANAGGLNSQRGSGLSARLGELDALRQELLAEIGKVAAQVDSGASSVSSLLAAGGGRRVAGSDNGSGSGVSGDFMMGLYSQLTGREIDGRFEDLAPDAQKQFYDNFMKELTKKVTHAVLNSDKFIGSRGAASGATAAGSNANINYRMLLDNFAQKVEDRLDDAREVSAEELARVKKELSDQFRVRLEVAMRELRAELMLLPSDNGESTAMGTKPVMCVACSRPVPVSITVRESGAVPPGDLAHPEPPSQSGPDYDLDRGGDDDFVYRGGFKMPANDRKILTLPFLTNAVRNKMVLNKPEGKRKRPARHHTSMNRVENVVREAMELDRNARASAYNTGSHQHQQ